MTPREAKPSTSFGGEWMNKIADLFGSADKNLDQSRNFTPAELEALKKSTNTATSLYAAFEKKFKKDLEEDGVQGDEAQKPYLAIVKAEWDKMEMGRVSSEISASTELEKITDTNKIHISSLLIIFFPFIIDVSIIIFCKNRTLPYFSASGYFTICYIFRAY